MNFESRDFAGRLEQLRAESARQRAELGHAYEALGRPLRYADYGLRGFGFLRRHGWLMAAAPALFSLGLGVAGRWIGGHGPSRRAAEKAAAAAADLKQKARRPVLTWLGWGLRAYQIYRKLRPYLL